MRLLQTIGNLLRAWFLGSTTEVAVARHHDARRDARQAVSVEFSLRETGRRRDAGASPHPRYGAAAGVLGWTRYRRPRSRERRG
jgi:hypothetical protein